MLLKTSESPIGTVIVRTGLGFRGSVAQSQLRQADRETRARLGVANLNRSLMFRNNRVANGQAHAGALANR